MTTEVAVSDFLEHYGVKGMRWGVRDSGSSSSPASSDSVQFKSFERKAKAGGVKALSNSELRAFNERANLERQFQQLNPSAKKKALQFTADILLGVGKQQAMRLASDVAAKQIANLLKT